MLQHAIKSVFPILAVILLAACGNSQQQQQQEQQQQQQQQQQKEQQEQQQAAAAPVQLKDEKAQAVYQHYVHLTTALINSDANEAKVAGTAIEAGAKELPSGAAIAKSAQQIALAGSLEAQRAQYITLSKDMIALVKSTGLNSGELYVDSCPMANDGKGAAWLSAIKEIKNPYFGEEMMTCGQVKETIK